MNKIHLGQTDIMVSEWCLGTMTMPNHTPMADAHRQIDQSLAAGINFIDTAEMYPVNPVAKETVGDSEACIGEWVAKSGRRSEAVIATKVSGDNPGFVRGGQGYEGSTIEASIDASLARLKTDYIDLYQLHWPMRGSYAFRQNWRYNPSGQNKQETLDHMADVLGGLDRAMKAGKIRAVGLSNESAWGTARWIDVSEQTGGPRMASVQNEYSLLCRMYDTDMSEMSVNEDITLLSYSPLACGFLTGKYQNGAIPKGSRMDINRDMSGRLSGRVFDATQKYLDLAAEHGLDPVHMAMAWQRTRPFAVSAIFGATTSAQFDHMMAGRDVVLDDDVIKEIDKLNHDYPMPY